MSLPSLSDLRSKYFEAEAKRREAKRQIEQLNTLITSYEAEMRTVKDAWMTLKKVFPDMPELDNETKGVFDLLNDKIDITTAVIKDWIEQAVDKAGRFIDKTDIRDSLIHQHGKDGLTVDHLKPLSQFLKHMRVVGRLVRAKGDNSNHLVYYGLPKWRVLSLSNDTGAFEKGREPAMDYDKVTWNFATEELEGND